MTEKTVLTYGDMKQTWESLPERSHISEEQLIRIQESMLRSMDEYARAFYGNPDGLSFGWCMPSRNWLLTQRREYSFEVDEVKVEEVIPVEEDSLFAPREVEVVCGNSS